MQDLVATLENIFWLSIWLALKKARNHQTLQNSEEKQYCHSYIV